jgi:hypothetical protein
LANYLGSTHPHAVNQEPSWRYNARADLLRDGRRDPAVRIINPLVYTFWGNHGPSIMTMTAALAE